MLLAIIVWVGILWLVTRLVLPPPRPRVTLRPATPRALRQAEPRLEPLDVIDPAEVLEVDLVRELLAGHLDATTYQRRMAALAASPPSWSLRVR